LSSSTDNNNNEFNKAADHLRYIIGANVIPANSRIKKPNLDYIETWKEWKDKPIPEWQHKEWKAQGAFNSGLAIVLGKLFHNPSTKHLYLNGIDADNAKAIQEICTRNGKTITIQELAQWTYVEQHDDRPNKMHLLVYSEGRPFVSKSSDQTKLADKLKANEVPAIEVKNIGAIFYVAPGIHRDKETLMERPIKIIGTNIPVLSNSFEQDLDDILSKYGISYLNGADSSNNSAKIPIDELFKEDFRIYEGHNRSEALLRVMESLIARNSSILTPDEIKDMARRWNNKHCIPPLDDKKFEQQWKCANKFTASSNTNNNGSTTTTNNSINNNNKKSKQAVLFITDKLLANYTFKTLRDTEEVYYYDSARGIYIPGGESLIKSEVEKEMPDISTNQVNEIINHIIRRTLTDRTEFDADIEWLTLKNCMVNLLTLETRPHSPEYMTTVYIPIPYDYNNIKVEKQAEGPIADFFELVVDPISHPCPGIMNFMYEVVSPEDVQTILDFIAYCLWRGFPFHILLFFNGTGRNGKGVMLTIIKRVLGFSNISGESLHRILENRFAVAELYGKLANIDADLSTDALRNTGTLKKLTGGDPIPAERKFQRPFKFVNYSKLIFSANEMPQTPDETDAFFARPIIINFPNQFIMGANADPYLADKITTEKELAGLLQIVLKRLPRVLKHGVFTPSSSIAENYDKYILSSNPIRAFTEKCVKLDSNEKPTKDEVYAAYRAFCFANKITIDSEQAFSRKMKKQEGFKDNRRRNRKTNDYEYYWEGIRIVDWKVVAEEGQETLT
jgi:putative DNA primase/helicase